MEKKWIEEVFNEPKIIGICGDINQAKSNTIYHLISYLKKNYKFNLFSYGLRVDLGEQKINTVEELEDIKNSVIFIDEFFNLFDLDDRNQKKSIESTLRLINHNNNILVLSGVADNYKKFVSSKLDVILFKKCTIGDFINGSVIKKKCVNYKGKEKGSSLLHIDIDECLVFDGTHYFKVDIPYLKEYDTKKNNKPIFESVGKNVDKSSEKCNKTLRKK